MAAMYYEEDDEPQINFAGFIYPPLAIVRLDYNEKLELPEDPDLSEVG
jgi:hypothetical protein